MKSLERQLHLWLAISLVVLMALMWTIGNVAIRHLTEDFAVSRLQHDAESLVAALEFNEQSETRLRWRRLNQVYNQPYSGHYFLIRVENEPLPIYSRSLWDSSFEIPALVAGETRRLHLDGPSGQKLLVWSQGFQKAGVNFTLAVAEDLTVLNAQRDRFNNYFALLAIVGLAGLLIIQRSVVRRAVRQLDPVRKDIKRLADGEAGRLSENVPQEVLPLVKEFNHLLILMSQRVERSRHSLGNLAHALKGPLSYLLQHFEEQPDAGKKQDHVQAKQQLDRIRELMERELKRARLVGKGVSSQRFSASQEMPDLIGLLKQIHAHQQLLIDYSVSPQVQKFGDREDMLELLGNLLDNACKWARHHVICSISEDSTSYLIVIEDDGEGLSGIDMDRLVSRGTRLDESIEGHGLGLSIVKDIVDLYLGRIEFERSPSLGGLMVSVTFPL